MEFFITLVLLSFCNGVISADIGHLTRKGLLQFVENINADTEIRDVEIPFPLPIDDTYGFDHAEFDLPGDIFSANITISKGSISGVSGFRLLELNIPDSKPIIGIKILFPTLKIHAENYNLYGNIYDAVPIKGTGVAHIEIYNLQISVTIYLKQSPVSHAVLIDKLEDAELHVDRIVSRTEFDHNIDEIISALVEDLLADYINRFNKYIIATYSDTFIEYINTMIEATK